MANRVKMDRQERAKQFIPFDALKGFRELLKEKEKVIVPKVELSEEAGEELDRKLRAAKRNDVVTVIYFQKGEYLKVTGMVARLDMTARVLQIVNTKIAFEDIYKIEGEKLQDF